ncbi:hypothetical protein HY031_02575 [Candidatus Gottesmanbacteria bacterium]|nr:hypothetical protein [Candidatus Gottesmanbacteria bacterium]
MAVEEVLRHSASPDAQLQRSISAPLKEIQFYNLSHFQSLIEKRIAQFGSAAILVAGPRRVGKTETSKALMTYAEGVLGRQPTSRPMIFQVDWALHPRGSPQRSLGNPLENFFHWDDLSNMLQQLVTAMKNGSTDVRLTGTYLRNMNGTTESKRGGPWILRRTIHQPHPVVVVEGSFAHDPRVTEAFRQVTEPILTLFNTDPNIQEQRALMGTTRSKEDEKALNDHDIREWQNYIRRHELAKNADIWTWSFTGNVVFYRNPFKIVKDTVGFLF